MNLMNFFDPNFFDPLGLRAQYAQWEARILASFDAAMKQLMLQSMSMAQQALGAPPASPIH